MLSGLLSRLPFCDLRGECCIRASLFGILLIFASHLYAATGGSVSGMVRDPSGAVIAGAELLLVNTGPNFSHGIAKAIFGVGARAAFAPAMDVSTASFRGCWPASCIQFRPLGTTTSARRRRSWRRRSFPQRPASTMGSDFPSRFRPIRSQHLIRTPPLTGRTLPHFPLAHSLVFTTGLPISATICFRSSGDPALCLSLAGCGPFGEDNTYTAAGGQMVHGTRKGQNGGPQIGSGENYGENTADKTIANSSYNALEATVRYQRDGSQFLLSYAFAKSIDQGSNIGEQLDPLDPRQSRAVSAWDHKHTFAASYALALPIERISRKSNRLTTDWTISGTARFATGFPVTLYDNSDNSLLGTLGNGVNNYLLDTPRYLPGPLDINTNGRNGKPAFNTALFPEENPGQLGNAKRRIFYGPGIENFDLTLQKNVRFSEPRSLEVRIEAFNAFNHAKFYGPASVNGQVEDPNFGRIVSAATPRLVQLVAKFYF
jgi:hypothetical protein